jgi:hypothetical protein
MHISFHAVPTSRGGLYAHPPCQAASVAGGNKSRPYEKNEDDTAVFVAHCIVVFILYLEKRIKKAAV